MNKTATYKVFMKKSIAIIPARGGSKRFPKKNLSHLNGKPLIAHTIEACLDAACFDRVVVSSEEEEILAVAKKYGADIYQRPQRLADDYTRVVDVIWHYLLQENKQNKYSYASVLLPTCPLRKKEDIISAWDLFKKKDCRGFVISVAEYDFPPQLALSVPGESGEIFPREEAIYQKTTRSQSLDTYYHPNGGIYLFDVESFLREKTFFSQPMYAHIMSKESSVDVDYPYQLEIARHLLNNRESQEQLL